MKFSRYKVEDFLSDKDFIEWVKGGQSLEKHIYFSQWISSNPKNLDDAYLAREIILSLKPHSLTPDKEDYDEVLSAIISRHAKRNPAQPISNKIRAFPRIDPVWIRAAIFLLLATFSVVLYKLNENPEKAKAIAYSEIVKENQKGQRSKLQLPDGSIVWLNAESQVRYQENFSADIRMVELKGEAFFEVEKDTQRPFVVKSGPLITTALGTAFNVNAYDIQNGIEVSLVHGKVEVKDADSDVKVILRPGEKAVGNSISQEVKKLLFNYEEEISWKDGIIFFDNADIEEVAGKLERWYNVKFEIVSYPAEKWIYNGSFDNMSLFQVLERMSFTERFTYEINNKIVTLKFDNEL